MKLSNYLHETGIDLDLRGTKKEEVIRNLADRLRERAQILDFDTFVSEVLNREKEFSTGIGDGIAIPHARTDAVTDFVVAVGRVPGGIQFDSIDHLSVDIVILMGTPAESKRTYLQFLATLNLLLKRGGIREALRAAKSPDEVIRIFRENEDGLDDR